MSILIIGGSGFIGRNLTAALLNKDQTVIVKTRNKQNTSTLFSSIGCEPTIIDNYDELLSLETLPETTISLAGAGIVDKRWTDQRKKELTDSRITPLRELHQWLQKQQVTFNTLLVGSATGYYGLPEDPDQELTENSIPTPHFTAELCGQLEHYGSSMSDVYQQISILRTGVVLGDGGALEKMTLPAKFHLNGKIGNGQQWLSWIHIDDWIRGILHILHQASPQPSYNLTAPNPATNQQFSQAIGNALGKKLQIPVPALSIKLLLGEASALLLRSQRVLPEALLESGFKFNFEEIEHACNDLLSTT
ncbi:MAG: TIGR01777 family oxidoreductase [Arenicella sp.]